MLYPFLGTIHLKILISSVFTRVCSIFPPGYRGEPKYWGTRYHENLQRLRDAFALAPDLLEAYDALQFFHEILMSFPYSIQQEDLTEWIHQYTTSEVEEIYSAACTIRHWRGYIQNSWMFRFFPQTYPAYLWKVEAIPGSLGSPG